MMITRMPRDDWSLSQCRASVNAGQLSGKRPAINEKSESRWVPACAGTTILGSSALETSSRRRPTTVRKKFIAHPLVLGKRSGEVVGAVAAVAEFVQTGHSVAVRETTTATHRWLTLDVPVPATGT